MVNVTIGQQRKITYTVAIFSLFFNEFCVIELIFIP